MTGFSVLTNPQAASAVLGLNKTLSALNTTQERINTGLKVGSARDDAATFAIALGMRSDVAGYRQIQENLNLGKSTVGTAAAAADSIAAEITKIKENVIQASNLETGRADIQETINVALDQIRSVTAAAQFNGVNLIDGNADTVGTTFDVVSSLNRAADGALSLSKINVAFEDLSVDNTGRGLNALTEVDVDTGRVSSTAQSFDEGTIRSAAVDLSTALDATDQVNLTYVDADGAEQTITFTANGASADAFEFNEGTNSTLADKINALTQDGGPLAGLGIVASEATDVVTVALEGPDAVGKIVGFSVTDVSPTTVNDAAANPATTTEAQSGIAQLDLQFNDQLKAGDEIQLTVKNGTTGNDTTVTLVVGEKDAGNTSGAAITGTNNKFVLDYEDVVQDGTATAKTQAEVASFITDLIDGTTTASAVAGNAGNLLNALNGAVASGDFSGTDFTVQAVGDSIRIIDQTVDANAATSQLVEFDGNAVTGTSLNFDQMLVLIDNAETHLKSAVARIGAAQQSLDSQSTFMDNLVKSVNDGIGTLVDANMAEESAKFQALQVQQQLGLQALSIANQQPQSILSLFR